VFHPHHNWFISCAHTEDDVKESLKVADEAFAIVKRKFGS
jgi:glutamate-1-semialdehyde 2,1-aminomutase